ncbi:mycofactocin biosynthesis FMN-dependent deaminase MftD [Gryllotalpicola kribbensis]|uniref:Mycofactocin biosynthesis FMN-dependent deaminase MftD n=1 Tax=Gryllotalpicola kribbensis TaxID=993084 RepID=A0ABP8AT04_9MICO
MPWRQNPWFETVLEAQRRAKKRLPPSVYAALVAGSERGRTPEDNQAAFAELQFAPHVAGHQSERELSTTVLGIPISLPVLISPTGVQAVHPEGEVAVARAAANRGTIMGLSSFASKPVEEVAAANPNTFFQMYWTGTREQMVQRMDRARAAGAKALIATLDWSFSIGRDWGSPAIPEKMTLKAMWDFAPEAIIRPKWLWAYGKTGRVPDLTTPNLQPPGGEAPTFFGAYYEWQQTPPPTWEDVAWLREEWGGPFILKGITRVDDAKRAVDAGVSAISVSNHGGNNLDTTPATIRCLPAVAAAVGDQVEVLLDGGVRRGGDVAKALALGARAVMIGRAYLWGLAANGQTGVENVLDLLRMGLDSAVLGLGHKSIHELSRQDLFIPQGFERHLGAGDAGAAASPSTAAGSSAARRSTRPAARRPRKPAAPASAEAPVTPPAPGSPAPDSAPQQ